MRNARTLTVALVTTALVGVSGVAYAVVQSVDNAPQPQVVIPSSATVGTDDPAGHDAGDDNGSKATESRHGADDPAGHDAGDDKGGATGAGTDDPAGHNAGDDNGGSSGHGSDG